MNKLYILGALALASVDGLVQFAVPTLSAVSVQMAALQSTVGTSGINVVGLGGTYTYAFTGDCLSSGALTTLGLNNNYYQYYYVALTTGTAVHATTGTTYAVDDTTPVVL
jgi:hypothetical protein